MEKEEKKCVVSPMYGKDESDYLYFYCDYCGEEMDYAEERICLIERDKCSNCNADIGNSEKSVQHCFSCDKKI